MKSAVLFLITVYAAVPVILYLFPWILGHAIFSHLVRFPFFVDLSRPEDVLNHTCNFYLSTEEGVSVGVWHTLPANQWEEASGKSPEWYRETLGDGSPVIIYLHGNVGTRAINHRVQLVKILSAAGYHVLSLDYRGPFPPQELQGNFTGQGPFVRVSTAGTIPEGTFTGTFLLSGNTAAERAEREEGFGDSSGEPSEAGLTSDALYLHEWVKKHNGGGLVCLWGHSLGTGVTTNTAVKLQEQGSVADALILEAPYTRIGDVVMNHPLVKMYTFLPGIESLMWNILDLNNIVLANDENLKALTRPLLILHAEDDNIVPYHMGLKLYQISLHTKKKYNSDVQVEMITYNAKLGLSHNNIYLDPNLSDVVGKFLQNLRK